MKLRLVPVALALSLLPLSVLSAPALAGPPEGRPCGNGYTNGKPFQLSTSPAANGPSRVTRNRAGVRMQEPAVRVVKGAEVALSARLFAANKRCPGERVAIKVKKNGVYGAVNTNVVTDDEGLVSANRVANADFRFLAEYADFPAADGRTGPTLVQVFTSVSAFPKPLP